MFELKYSQDHNSSEIIINTFNGAAQQLNRLLKHEFMLAVSEDGCIYVDAERGPLVDQVFSKHGYDFVRSGDGRWVYKKKGEKNEF